MKYPLAVVALLMIFVNVRCVGQKDSFTVSNKVYESCCGAETVEYTSGDAYIYVPNVFTPNGDYINDYFVPTYKQGILGFDAYYIYTPVGDTLVFASAGYDPNNIANTAWNGLRQDGSPYVGAFKYYFTVHMKSGGLFYVEGKACRIECGPDADVFVTKIGCFYPSQVNTTTDHLDPTIPNKEVGCFH